MGYPPKDLLFYHSLIQNQAKFLARLKRKSKDIAIIVGAVGKSTQGLPLKNNAPVFLNGQQYTYAKQLLPNYDVFDEKRYFEPGDGTLVLKIHGKKIGITICEDIWFTDDKLKHRYTKDPLTEYEKKNLDYLINISASPFEFDKIARRKKVVAEAAKKVKCPVIYLNQLGGNDDLIFDGGCYVYNELGKPIKESNHFSDELVVFNTDESLATPLLKEVKNPYMLIKQALVLGIHDYVRKTGFHQVVLGLSGGVDSALVACLAAEALGAENVLGVLMPSRYSSKGSVEDAMQLAKNIGIGTQTISIEPLHTAYEKLFQNSFTTEMQELTLQNIQARIRGNILMAISNDSGRLLLNTTNKSEMAMGYGTLYGDLCGALAVISDLTKTQVYELCDFINLEREIIPKEILTKEPSAELKPNQKDSDTLPPYPILDPFVIRFIEQQSADTPTLGPKYPSEKVMQTILRNEYKRFQAPLGLKISTKAFGSGRRMPIVARVGL